MVEFHTRLLSEDEEIISLLDSNIINDTINDDYSIIECADNHITYYNGLITEILQINYDSRWIISNKNKYDLSQRLSKQRNGAVIYS